MKLEKTGICQWRLPVGSIPGMRVPGVVYADEKMIKTIQQDGSLQQLANATTLPGIHKAALAMPDIHFGYGLPIGGILACRKEDGVISPGGVGYDINCGVRLLRTPLRFPECKPHIERLTDRIFRAVPCGVGSGGKLSLKAKALRLVLMEGANWAIRNGYGVGDDGVFCESSGVLEGADPDYVGEHALERGRDQLGTLGSGNHFIEIQTVRKIIDPVAASVMGLAEDQITVMIHSGSRGLGHQVCTDYVKRMVRALDRYRISIPDKQLACAPFDSEDARQYFGAMKAAANFAWANRQCLTHWIRAEFNSWSSDITPESMGLIYDVAHNIVKIETHSAGKEKRELIVHRKGATRAFGPGHSELPARYREIGQPVLVPGDMGTASYVMVGTNKAMQDTFGSACHGAGRKLSRKAAMKQARKRSIVEELRQRGVYARAHAHHTLMEEMPDAYKNISDVIRVMTETGIARVVAELRPLGVIKG